jgi:hypothetical protein
MMTVKKAMSSSVISICLLTILGCEVKTSVKLDIGPSFLLNGSGHLESFSIYGPQPGHRIATPNDAKSQLWSIQRSNLVSQSGSVANMSLAYGTVPAGYKQSVPASGPAPALTAGLVYYFFAETTGAPGKEGFFYMDKTAPVLINVPGMCESAFVGNVKALKCGTKEAYVEPDDLEQFVRQNRIPQ